MCHDAFEEAQEPLLFLLLKIGVTDYFSEACLVFRKGEPVKNSWGFVGLISLGKQSERAIISYEDSSVAPKVPFHLVAFLEII
jgi:hypothetical protein